MNPALEVINIYKQYQNQRLLCGVSFSVYPGETVGLLGTSGSGKSTLLRIIAGLELAESGGVLWQGKDITPIPVHQRGFGLMFQDYALFPHLDVYENVAFGLKMRNLPQKRIIKLVNEALDLVNMHKFRHRQVTDLSGGEQQRVALARALAPQPKLLMLDEPLGALDKTMKEQLGIELRTLLHTLGIPSIYVTHDQQEAFTITDRLVILHNGRVIQQGIAQEIIKYPATLWLAKFLGFHNIISGNVISLSPLKIKTPIGVFVSSYPLPRIKLGKSVKLVLKPDGVKINKDLSLENVVHGRVADTVFRGDGFLTKILTSDWQSVSFLSQLELKKDTPISIVFPSQAVLVYAK